MALNCNGGGANRKCVSNDVDRILGTSTAKMPSLLRFLRRDTKLVIQVHLEQLSPKLGLSLERRLQSSTCSRSQEQLSRPHWTFYWDKTWLAWMGRRRCGGLSSPWCPSSGWPGGPAPSSSWPAQWCPPPRNLWSPDGRCWPAGRSSEMGSR